ncbi:hypothetical protein ES708_27792 [subsurface metagenome]
MMRTPPSLVRVPTKLAVKFSTSWSPKARRWYQRVLSGVTHHQANRRPLRVITLTTSPRARASGLDINTSWGSLVKRLRRRWPVSGFEYWKLRTSEGNGVLHIIYSGPFIPQGQLSRLWDEIHNSPIVYIQKMRFRRKRLVNYLMKHYLPAHDVGGLYTRMSWSWGWVFRGFCGAWKWFWKRGPTRYDAIIEWNKLMRRANPLWYYKNMRGLLYEQTLLKKRGIYGTVVF